MLGSTGHILIIFFVQVFQLSGIRERLEAVGVSSTTAEQFMKLLVELDLLGEGQVSNLMAVSEAMEKEERERLAELLYTHLVHWLGQCTVSCEDKQYHFWSCLYYST